MFYMSARWDHRHLYLCLRARVCLLYFILGMWHDGRLCEATQDNLKSFLEHNLGYSSNNVDGIENGGGWLVSLSTFFSEPCQPGTFSNTGLKPCEPCNRRSYQPNFEQKSCINCSGTKATLQSGSTSSSSCIGMFPLSYHAKHLQFVWRFLMF